MYILNTYIYIHIYIYIYMAVSILFLVQDIPCTPKFSEHDFGKLSQRPIELEEFLEEGRSLNFGAQPLVLAL